MPKKTEMGLRLRDEIPFPIGGRFRIAEHSSTRKRPFLSGWRGRPCLERPVSGLNAQIIGRPDLPAPVSSSAKQILSSGNPLSHRGMVPHCRAFVHPETPFPAGMEGTPLSGAPRFRFKRSDHRKTGSSGPRSTAARSKSSPAEIPFPIGGGSALRSIRPPGNVLSCRGGGDAPVWSAPLPA